MAPRFARGTTIRISTETVDYDDDLTTPDTSITVTVLKGSTEVRTAVAMVNNGVGKHYYRWQTLTSLGTGKYETKITAVHSGYTSIEHDEQAFYLY